MSNGIGNMEENVSGLFHWTCPPQIFVEIRQDFWIKKTRLSVSFRDNRTTFPIPLRETRTQTITFLAPIGGRARVGITICTPARIYDRE
jgi:hypothetical protein